VQSVDNEQVYSYDPATTDKWYPLAKGVYSTSCLTQCVFLSPITILTAGTDGHTVLWPLETSLQEQDAPLPSSTQPLTWSQAFYIHQSSSKTLTTHIIDAKTLIVSGGDDGSLTFCITDTYSPVVNFTPPIILTRAHASAVTACAILTYRSHTFVLTSGNDQWVRLWEVVLHLDTITQPITEAETRNAIDGDPLSIQRVGKIKTNVADVSSMAVLGQNEEGVAKVLICGVGMEIIRVEWKDV
jgi:WD40 repeat protein